MNISLYFPVISIVQLVPVSGQLNCTQWRKLNAYDSSSSNLTNLNSTEMLKMVFNLYKMGPLSGGNNINKYAPMQTVLETSRVGLYNQVIFRKPSACLVLLGLHLIYQNFVLHRDASDIQFFFHFHFNFINNNFNHLISPI